MDYAALHRGEDSDFHGSVKRHGKIFAQNSNACMEESYPTAYNLGSGRARWPGWVNVDGSSAADIKADLRDLPIESDSADAVAAIHVLEHFYAWETEALIAEWKRILKPGGKLIIELPCMEKVFEYIAWCMTHNGGQMLPFMTLHALYGDHRHKSVEMCHKFGFFTHDVVTLLKAAGFSTVEVCEPRYHFKFRDMRLEATK